MSVSLAYDEYDRPDDPDKGDRIQMAHAPFWQVYDGYGWYKEPIDDHAVYGYPRLGDRDPETIDVPIRRGGLKPAIRCLGGRHSLKRHPSDVVRPADRDWYRVVQPTRGGFFTDEGFLLRRDEDDDLCYLEPYGGPRNRPLVFGIPWLRRADNNNSMGAVECLEIVWGDDRGARP